MKNKFEPVFKEKNNEFFIFSKGKWIKSNEEAAFLLWEIWASSNRGHRLKDSEGFIIYTYKIN